MEGMKKKGAKIVKVYVSNWREDIDTNGVIGVYGSYEKALNAVNNYAEEMQYQAVYDEKNSSEEKKVFSLKDGKTDTYESCYIETFELN
jgi:hypothetical protein